VMMDDRGTLWSTAELANAVLAIAPESGQVERIELGGAPHWIAISHATGKLFASFKTREAVAVVDLDSRKRIDVIAIPHGAEGLAVSPDGAALYVCAHRKGVVHAFDTRTHALTHTLAIEGAPGEANQLRRTRVSPDGRYLCASSHVDNYAAVYDAHTLKQIAGFATPKAPMGFGFAADGEHAFLCCHDAAVTLEFALVSGRITRQFPTAAGCEFVISY
jgi:DNA-binding beta-propeller fold protein YncE